jgi:hypothetical protein
MHLRTRRNVVQLIRTTYDPLLKKPKTAVVGRMRLDQPELDDKVRAILTEDELREVQEWIDAQGRTMQLREELAGLTLAEHVTLANRWFARNARSAAAAAAAASLMPKLHALRKTLRAGGLVE